VIAAAAALAMFFVITMFNDSPRARADDREESLIKWGFQIAPVPLNMVGKNRALVGLGGYLVNAVPQ
jgi:hypothetical protein